MIKEMAFLKLKILMEVLYLKEFLKMTEKMVLV